jgi:hypothetical protein
MLSTLGELIHRKLKDALLPMRDPVRTWTGQGRGARCDGCDAPILPSEREYGLVFDDGRAYHLHVGCCWLWETGRRRRHASKAGWNVAQIEREDPAALIAEKIAAGTLPTGRPVKVFVGHGNGQRCDGCDLITLKTDIEDEADLPSGRSEHSGSTKSVSPSGMRSARNGR